MNQQFSTKHPFCYVLDNIRNKDCGAQRALRTLPVGGLQQEQVFLSARYLLSKYTTNWRRGWDPCNTFS